VDCRTLLKSDAKHSALLPNWDTLTLAGSFSAVG
jgi:hypothetical protein